MLILSVDTSCNVCRVGLFENNLKLGEIAEDNKKSHSVKLMPMIESLLADCKKNISDIDVFAVVNGPGSYTGLRIGVTTCKLLGYSTSKPVVTVNTLDQLAYSCGVETDNVIVCPCIDARNSRVFYSLYLSKGNELMRICEYDADDINVVADKIQSVMDEYGALSVCISGDGFVANKTFLTEKFGDSLLDISDDRLLGTSQAIQKLALATYTAQSDKSYFDSKNTEVFYLRMPHITLKSRD